MIFLLLLVYVRPRYNEVEVIINIYMRIITNIEKIQELYKKYKFETTI